MITDVSGWVSSIAGVLALLVCWIPVIGQALAAVFLLVAGNVASAERINAKAAVELGARNMEKLTVRQAIRLTPSELADSEGLFAKQVADLQPGQTVYRLHGGAFPKGASYSTFPPSSMANPRSWPGLPRVNTGENLIIAKVDHIDNGVVTRHASRTATEQPTRRCARVRYTPAEFGPVKGVTTLSDTPLRVR